MKILFVTLGLLFFFVQPTFASSEVSDTVVELTEKIGDITSSSTSDDKTEAHQLLVQSENYYANPSARMGNALARQVEELKKHRPELSTDQAVDYIYANIR